MQCKDFLQIDVQPCHKRHMARAKKAKRSNNVVMYTRLQPELHVQIERIAKERGWPHTIASVAAEMIARGLKTTEKREERA